LSGTGFQAAALIVKAFDSMLEQLISPVYDIIQILKFRGGSG
jgi:hypothetical protein